LADASQLTSADISERIGRYAGEAKRANERASDVGERAEKREGERQVYSSHKTSTTNDYAFVFGRVMAWRVFSADEREFFWS